MTITNETKVLIGILLATVVIIVGGAFWAARSTTAPTEPVANAENLVRADDPVLGSQDAAVSVVEFGDFECPACGALHPVLKQVKADFADDSAVRFVYRHFPLRQHPNAALAAEASVEAQKQGKFWEYHDLLFENQNALERADLERYAEQLNLNLDQFKQALNDRVHRDAVDQDASDGRGAQIQGTPTLFIDGVPYNGRYSVVDITAAIEAAKN